MLDIGRLDEVRQGPRGGNVMDFVEEQFRRDTEPHPRHDRKGKGDADAPPDRIVLSARGLVHRIMP